MVKILLTLAQPKYTRKYKNIHTVNIIYLLMIYYLKNNLSINTIWNRFYILFQNYLGYLGNTKWSNQIN